MSRRTVRARKVKAARRTGTVKRREVAKAVKKVAARRFAVHK